MKRLVPILILISFWLLFFWRQIVGGEVWYCCDNLLVSIPAKVFLAEELKQGRFPIWNPYLFSATPFFADINLAVLHPLNLLYLVIPPFRALTVGILVLFLVGSVGMYVLGRTLTLGSFASLVGAVVFGFSGSLVVYANNISILQVAVLVPWVIAMWSRYLVQPTGKRLVVFVLIASFQIISGHPQVTYYTWLLLIAYAFLEKPELHTVKRGFKASLLVVLVTSVQTIPFLEFALHSTRVGRDFVAATTNSVHPLSLIRLIIPGTVGDLSHGTAWIQAGSIHGYVGLLPLLLLPFGWKSRTGKFFIAIAAVSLFMAMGTYTPIYWLAFHVVPGFAWFREPGQFLFLWCFGLAGVMMIAVQSLSQNPQGVRRYILTISLLFLLSAGFFHTQNGKIWEYVLSLKSLPTRLPVKLASLPMQQREIITDGLYYNLALFGTLGTLASVALGRLRTSSLAKVILLGVLFADLYIYGQTNVTTLPEATISGWQESTKARIASWSLSGVSQYRYYTDPAVYPYPEKKPFGQFNDPGESAWQFAIFRPNTGMLYGLSAVDGYASMVSSSYQRWFGQPSRDPTGVTISSIVDPRLVTAGVRYIITKPNNPRLADTKRYRVLTVDKQIATYEDMDAVLLLNVKTPNSVRYPPASVIGGGLLTLIGVAWCLVLCFQKKPHDENTIDDA